MAYRNHFSTRMTNTATSQSKPIPGRESDMVRNAAGGFVFSVDDWTRLRRFLVLGTTGGTFYASERDLTLSGVEAVVRCLREDGLRVVREVIDVSVGGRAVKQDAGLYVLAMAAAYGSGGSKASVNTGDIRQALMFAADERVAETVRKAALDALPRVARTLSALYTFTEYVEGFRGWGRGLRKAYANWFNGMDAERLSLQLVKYGQRNGWSARDVLRMARPVTDEADRKTLFDWATHRDISAEDRAAHERRLADNADKVRKGQWSTKTAGRNHAEQAITNARADFRLVEGLYRAREATSASEVAEVIRSHSLPREAVPTEWLNEKAVWDALLVDMPMTAMIRNLNKMTAVGLITPGSDAARFVADQLGDVDVLRKARIHPMQVLLAMKTYGQGSGYRSVRRANSLTWTPVSTVVDALDAAFYGSFGNVQPTGKRIMKALDVSGSMGATIGDTPLSCREAAAAMAMVSMAVEKAVHSVAFTVSGGKAWKSTNGSRSSWYGSGSGNGITPIDISSRRRLDDVVASISRFPHAGTDCALPMLYAMEKGIEVDVFEVYTDNESWAGDIHAAEALRRYRDKTGIPAKLVAVAMTATSYSVADPNDAGMLDCVGFDTSTPNAISDFINN